MTGPFTWKQAREDVARLHEDLADALARANRAMTAPDRSVPVGAEYREAYMNLCWDIRELAADIERLRKLLAESSEPERPDRLAVALGKIRAFGHTCVDVSVSVYNGKPYTRCNSYLPEPERVDPPWGERPYAEWAQEVERGEATVESDDVAAAAEARLEQIRALRKQQRAAVVALVEALSYRPSPRFIVERRPGAEGVMYWMIIDTAGEQENRLSYVEDLARADADRLNAEHAETADLEWLVNQGTDPGPAEAAVVHFRSSVSVFGYVCGRDRNVLSQSTDDPDGVTCPACRAWVAKNVELSPEDIDAFMAAVEEHDTRWNVWSKHPAEGWEQINSNLNSEQAHAAVERLTRVDLLGVVFVALPIGQVPGGPPVDASDAVVFLNPDPDVQPITGPTDAEEAALARADHERVREASEEDR